MKELDCTKAVRQVIRHIVTHHSEDAVRSLSKHLCFPWRSNNLVVEEGMVV